MTYIMPKNLDNNKILKKHNHNILIQLATEFPLNLYRLIFIIY